MLNIGNVLTLADDNEYVVVDQFEKDANYYVYLADIKDEKNVIYGKIDGDDVVELSDAEELEMVIKMIYNHTHNPNN